MYLVGVVLLVAPPPEHTHVTQLHRIAHVMLVNGDGDSDDSDGDSDYGGA